MTKSNPHIGPEHSREREFTAVLEDLRSQFRTFGESLGVIQEKTEKIPEILERLERVEGDVAVIKAIIPTLASKKDLTDAIQPLATKKDLEKFEKRLIAIEAR